MADVHKLCTRFHSPPTNLSSAPLMEWPACKNVSDRPKSTRNHHRIWPTRRAK
jgi:hypothetical protein